MASGKDLLSAIAEAATIIETVSNPAISGAIKALQEALAADLKGWENPLLVAYMCKSPHLAELLTDDFVGVARSCLVYESSASFAKENGP